MNPLALLGTYRVAIELVVLGLLLAALGAQTWRLHSEQAGRADDRAGFSEERLLASRASAAEEARNRAEEKRVRAQQQEKIDETEQKLVQERADRAVSDAAAGRLQQRVAALVAAAREAARGPAAAEASAPAGDAAGVLAELLGRCGQAVRLLAAIADERGSAGQLCEQSYDALTP